MPIDQYRSDIIPETTPRNNDKFVLQVRNKIANIFLTMPDDKVYDEIVSFLKAEMDSEIGLFGYYETDFTVRFLISFFLVAALA